MIDPDTRQRLHELLRRECLSELQYVGQAFPWASTRGQLAVRELEQMIAAEAEALADLGRWLTRKRIPLDYLGTFPSSFTTLNFLALAHLLPRLIALEKQLIAALDEDLAAVTHADVKARLQRLLDLKVRHAAQMELLAHPDPEPLSA